ncbi:hypothetical protein EMCRGX_G021518 [Ephydatia muelleri]
MKHVGQAIIKESSTEHQAAHVENENSDDNVLDQSIRKDHDMSDGYEDDGNIDDCDDKNDEDEEEERDPNFLVPTYISQPDPDDLCALKWGKDHFMRYLPSMKRKPYRKQQCPFERDFIRKVVKEMEPAIRRIQTGKQKSVFYQHISKVEKNLKSDWN